MSINNINKLINTKNIDQSDAQINELGEIESKSSEINFHSEQQSHDIKYIKLCEEQNYKKDPQNMQININKKHNYMITQSVING